LDNESSDSVALIYAHFNPDIRAAYHQKIAELIKPRGLMILEAINEGHLEYRNANPSVGGPRSEDILFSKDSVNADFPHFESLFLSTGEVELNEGTYHNGIAMSLDSLVRNYLD